jgi:hypothetical protein
MDYPQHAALENARKLDAVQVAEDMATEDGAPQAKLGYGIALLQRQREITEAICSENDDIYYAMGIDECLRILADEGFAVFEADPTDYGRSWLLWHEEYKLLGALSSYTQHTGFEKLNDLIIYTQFIGKEAQEQLVSHGYYGSGTVRVRREDLQDIILRHWTISATACATSWPLTRPAEQRP